MKIHQIPQFISSSVIVSLVAILAYAAPASASATTSGSLTASADSSSTPLTVIAPPVGASAINTQRQAGYIANEPQVYSQVDTTFKVPQFSCNGQSLKLSALWDGLQHFYDNNKKSTLHQVGVVASCKPQLSVVGFYEDFPAPPHYISGSQLKINRGDTIRATVKYLPGSPGQGQTPKRPPEYVFTLHDVKSGKSFTPPKPSVCNNLNVCANPRYAGIVEERNFPNKPTTNVPLVSQNVTFSNSTTTFVNSNVGGQAFDNNPTVTKIVMKTGSQTVYSPTHFLSNAETFSVEPGSH